MLESAADSGKLGCYDVRTDSPMRPAAAIAILSHIPVSPD
jgi:hypothetical protein